MRRFCLYEQFHDYRFLAFSKSSDGLFCLACTLFLMATDQGFKAELLISQPYRNCKNAPSDLSYYAVIQYHKDSMETLNSFVSCFRNPNRRVSIWNFPRRMLLQNPLQSESFKNENRSFIFENLNCIFFAFQSNLDYFIKILTNLCNGR